MPSLSTVETGAGREVGSLICSESETSSAQLFMTRLVGILQVDSKESEAYVVFDMLIVLLMVLSLEIEWMARLRYCDF